MKSISIDIETFSSANLQKCGVYKYAESSDFEILLFAYSVNYGEVVIIDLANGEKIPDEIIAALYDENIVKWAFNAQFERVCLSRHLNQWLEPNSWRCTMVWSATLGLPLSLEGVGAVLGLDKQKLSEGKSLIRYFCVPCNATKINGNRMRNFPHHDLQKWNKFKEYNKRDVETEIEVQQKISRFPVSDELWSEYHLDQEINDRGIGVDMEFSKNAIRLDEITKAQLYEKMQKLTDLENPNSVAQMKSWLEQNGLEMASLGKKEVAEVLKTAPPLLSDVLTLRGQLSKSSVKKYTAIENSVCGDNRVRGMFQFYGANRTGRGLGD